MPKVVAVFAHKARSGLVRHVWSSSLVAVGPVSVPALAVGAGSDAVVLIRGFPGCGFGVLLAIQPTLAIARLTSATM